MALILWGAAWRKQLLALLLCLATHNSAGGSAGVELGIETWYVDEIEVNTCSSGGVLRTYWLFRGCWGWCEDWISESPQLDPKRRLDGRWVLIFTPREGRVPICVIADTIYCSRTDEDVELAERPFEAAAGHIRHGFRRIDRNASPIELIPAAP